MSGDAKRSVQTNGAGIMLKADFPKFEQALKRFAKKVELDGATVTKRVAFDLFTRVIQKTPVDTGRARASWTIAIGAPDLRIVPEGQYDASLATAIAKANAVLGSYGTTGRPILLPVYIANNLPYIQELEKGSSQQAPQGMLAVSLMEVTNSLNKLSQA